MASLPVAAMLGEEIRIPQDVVRCCISWRRLTAAAHPDLHLNAILADASGEELGVVTRDLRERNRSAAEQWEANGVKHIAFTGAKSEGSPLAMEGIEEIEISFGSLRASGVVEFVFLLVSAPGIRAVKELASALLEVSGCDCRLDLIAHDKVKSCNFMLACLFCPGGDGKSWSLLPALFPIEGSADSGSIPAELLQQVAKAGKSKTNSRLAPIPAPPSMQELQEGVSALEQSCEFEEAAKKQGMLVQMMMESGNSPKTTEDALARLEYLQARANDGCIPSSTTSIEAKHEYAQLHSHRLEQARIEPLGDGGYQEMKALSDPAAMSAYLSRAIAAKGWPVDELRIMGIITAKLPETYDEILELFRPEIDTSFMGSKPLPNSGYSTGTTAVSGSVQTRSVLQPPGGSTVGGDDVRWMVDGDVPEELRIGGRPCAALEDGVFVTPMCKVGCGPQLVIAIYADGREEKVAGGFCYWVPGEILELEPDSGPTHGGCEVGIKTNDLGAPITEVTIGDIVCDHTQRPSSSTAEVALPLIKTVGRVDVVVKAANGNTARRIAGFDCYPPAIFGYVGQRIELSNENATARRVENINGAVCLGAHPMRRCAQGRYFEVELSEWTSSMQSMAIGVAAAQDTSDILLNGRIRVDDARDLKRVWVAGYDSRGAQFINDGNVEPILEKSWRPVKDLRPSADKTPIRLGVLWFEPHDNSTGEPTLVIFQDGVERVRLPAAGRLPARSEDLHALVDLCGNVTCATLIEDALPP